MITRGGKLPGAAKGLRSSRCADQKTTADEGSGRVEQVALLSSRDASGCPPASAAAQAASPSSSPAAGGTPAGASIQPHGLALLRLVRLRPPGTSWAEQTGRGDQPPLSLRAHSDQILKTKHVRNTRRPPEPQYQLPGCSSCY